MTEYWQREEEPEQNQLYQEPVGQQPQPEPVYEEEPGGCSWRGILLGLAILVAVVLVFVFAILALAGLAGLGPAGFLSSQAEPTAATLELPTLSLPPTPSVLPTLVASPRPTDLPAASPVPTFTLIPTPAPIPSATPAPPTPTAEPQATLPPTATPEPVLPSEIQVGGYAQVVNTGGAGLSLRAGPGLNNVRFVTADEGVSMPVVDGPMPDEAGDTDDTGTVFNWWYVRYTDGTEGWARSDFLAPALPPGE